MRTSMKLGNERLIVVADFLEKLENQPDLTNGMRWDFAFLNNRPFNKVGCGTLGCAIGSLPFIFPKLWKYKDQSGNKIYIPSLKYSRLYDSWANAQSFFCLTGEESVHLFHPNAQLTDLYGGSSLGVFAKPAQVASNIREFVRRRGHETGKD